VTAIPPTGRWRAPSIFAGELSGFPRHLSQHVGGFVLTEDYLDTIVPIGPAAMEDAASSNGQRRSRHLAHHEGDVLALEC